MALITIMLKNQIMQMEERKKGIERKKKKGGILQNKVAKHSEWHASVRVRDSQ